ncbi:hypothetical protein SAMN06265222_106142 [Neorhodopirellula lusitana]|uniref:Uncharacterized protein n=1 Tax=Neorhodopirellula lusitana TaxID=445327 RepID=A0ABY1Q4B7_9BACT|nr:hypothetical protein [Neorhodopirellula lusitana]SMP58905.1 hypothetical protein SAMN06265222_106142 [Neorhodopirellula lusitana]
MGSSKDVTIGYFSTVNTETAGWTGGLLVLNAAGRPLEFQCTLPIRPSKAHEILFGSTLREHLISEVIGPTLLQKCRTPISLLCCQQVEALALQENLPRVASSPTVTSGTTATDRQATLVGYMRGADETRKAISSPSLAGHCELPIGDATLFVAMELLEATQAAIDGLNDMVDATEPFERITEAIREAQSQMARAA